MPTGLDFLIKDKILPSNPPSSSYEWTVYGERHGCDSEEELIRANNCVVWSQGGVLRRVFKFDHEDQQVQHATLTWFPKDDDDAITGEKRTGSSTQSSRSPGAHTAIDPKFERRRHLARALVVLLQSQAHIYFIDGHFHAVNIPFDVERIYPAPLGILILRKQTASHQPPPSPKAPAPPPNSFWSSQNQNVSSQIHSTLPPGFEKPYQSGAPSRGSFSLVSLPSRTTQQTFRELPSLFTLTDPLSELGLVVEGSEITTSNLNPRLEPLSGDEDVLYVTPFNDCHVSDDDDFPFMLIVTANRASQTYSLWHASYPRKNDTLPPARTNLSQVATPSLRVKKRRSHATRMSTGAGTPTIRAGDMLSDQNLKRQNQVSFEGTRTASQRLSESFMLDGEYDADFPAPDDFNLTSRSGVTTKDTRRTSSMMARAELSSQDQFTFNDLARFPPAPSVSFGRYSKRPPSFGYGSLGRSRLSGRASTPGSTSFLSDVDESMNNDGAIDLLEDLISTAQLEASDRASFRIFRGLKKELVVMRTVTVPFEQSSIPLSQAVAPPEQDTRVVIVMPGSSRAPAGENSHMILYIIHPQRHKASELSIPLITANINSGTQTVKERRKRRTLIPGKPFHVRTLHDVYDINTMYDSGHAQTMILKQNQMEKSIQLPLQALSSPEPSTQSSIYLRLADFFGTNPGFTSDQTSLVTSFGQSGSLGCFDIRAVDGNDHRFQLPLVPRQASLKKAFTIIQQCISRSVGISINMRGIWFCAARDAPTNKSAHERDTFIVSILILILSQMGSSRASVFAEDALVSSSAYEAPDSQQRLMSTLDSDPFWRWCVPELSRAHRPPLAGSVITLTHCLRQARNLIDTDVESQSSVLKSIFTDETSTSTLIQITFALFLIYEDTKTTSKTDHDILCKDGMLGQLIIQLAAWFGLGSLVSQLEQEGAQTSGLDSRVLIPLQKEVQIHNWPRTHELLNSSFKTAAQSLTRLQSIVLSTQARPKGQAAGLEEEPELFSMIRADNILRQVPKESHHQIFSQYLEQHNIGSLLLESLPLAAVQDLRSALLACEKDPPVTWSKHMSEIVGRTDLSLLLDPSVARQNAETRPNFRTAVYRDVRSICSSEDQHSSHETPRVEPHEDSLRQIFRDDKRYAEAARLIDPVRVALATIHIIPDQAESAFLERQKEVAQKVYQRTMALPSGQAIMRFSINTPILTEKIKISTFNTTCLMQPSNNSVNADKSNFTEEKVGWAFFHAGVNAGLQVSRDAQGIDTSWLVLNKPNELGNRHAGLLLGLGLNGHLKKMARWLAFKYLTSKHTMTSVGLLIGLSASNLGTQDSLVTRLISVHVTRLLPPGAAQLNISPLTQTAGILGVGLLYFNTQHRRMSEVMLSEIEHVDADGLENGPNENVKDEAYRFGAGCSLGLINLGMGRDLHGLHDLNVVQRLLAVATGPRQIKSVHELDQATAGATIALAMIFMKSNDLAIATKLEPLECVSQFNNIRPDILLLRTVARWLITWDEIEPSLSWVKEHSIGLESPLDSLNADNIPALNITAGLCWCIALKHAGTASEAALEVLMHYIKLVRKSLTNAPTKPTFDASLTLASLQRFCHLLALSMAIVCAGTGNLAVLRQLRAMHAEIEGKTFGLHQATHMAMGMLFIGHGRYTFSTSTLSIAALLISFYPLFPSDVQDNRAQLQAMRHFWVLGVEARVLVPRDCETMEPIVLPIEVVFKQQIKSQDPRDILGKKGKRRQQLQREPGLDVMKYAAPCQLPELDTIAQIKTVSTEYWTVVLDFENNVEHRAAFERHGSIFLQRKPLMSQIGDVFSAEFVRLDIREGDKSNVLRACEWLFSLPAFKDMGIDGVAEGVLNVPVIGSRGGENERPVDTMLDPRTTAVDDAMSLKRDAESSESWNDLMWLRRLLDSDEATVNGSKRWLRQEWVDALRARVLSRTITEEAAEEEDEMIVD